MNEHPTVKVHHMGKGYIDIPELNLDVKRTWTKIAKEHTKGKEQELSEMFSRLEWQTIPCEMAMAPGEGIKAAIKEFHIPKVSEVAYSHELAPYGLMGIKAQYKNGNAVIYIIDEGSSIKILASDFTETQEGR